MGFHFDVKREDFLKALATQQNITNKKGTLTILDNILLEIETDKIVLTATDLEIGLKKIVSAEVSETGILTLPSKKLFELVRESGSVTLTFREQENNWVEIIADSSVYRLAGTASDEFPQFPLYEKDSLIQIESEIIADLIDKTSYCIAINKENMFTLTAALLQIINKNDQLYLKMITSDGHRLSIMCRSANKNINDLKITTTTLIPRRGIQEIRKFCENKTEFCLGIEEKKVVLKSDDSLLIIRLMDGDFPDFHRLLKSLSNDNSMTIDRLRFLEGLKRINLFAEDLFNAIKIDIYKNKMILTSQNSDYGSAKDEFPIEYSGSELSLGFNCRYFIESMQVMESSTIIASISNQESPCMITSEEDKGFLSVIMPMKI